MPSYTGRMPEVRDKRRKADLDLFVLALVDSGVATPYALQMTAGLSPGASIPALQRLTEAGLVRQGKPGSRGRTEHRVMPAGKKLLKTGWRNLIEEGPSGDLDSDLRVALLALASGEQCLAKSFLVQSAARKIESISMIERPADSDSLPPLAFWYRELRTASGRSDTQGRISGSSCHGRSTASEADGE
jgi:DNA-binding PadR family transcriptional regulator